MIELDEIRNRARRDLVIVTNQGIEDCFLWERSVRITNTAVKIAHLPEMAKRPVNLHVLHLVGYYHDAGWISQYLDGEITREQIGCKLTSPVQRELGAALMERSLEDLVPAELLREASLAIRSLNDHDVEIYESQLVADAENLDAFGALAIWHIARKHVYEGRGLSAALETWQTQKLYGYWSARIKDSLRFPAVKNIAQNRLAVFEEMIRQLAAHHHGEDIPSRPMESARTPLTNEV